MIIIRKMTSDDKDKIFEMMREFYNSPAVISTPSDETLKNNINDAVSDLPFIEGYTFVDKENIIGYAMIAKSYSTEYGGICIWIEDIYIIPQYRHQGIGSRFLTIIENLYKGTAVLLKLEAEHENTNAVVAYKKNGFSELDYIEMIKEI